MGDSGEDQDAMPEGGGVKTMFTVAVLQTQLQDLESKYAATLKENTQLRAILEGDKAEQADIYYYLRKKLDDNYASMAELEAQYLQEQKDREAAEAMYESRLKEMEAYVKQTKERTEDKLLQMEEKVAGLQDFAVRRAEIEEEAKANAEACQLEKEKAKATVDEMERKCIRAKEALRKDLLVKIEETKASLEGVARDKVDEMTKKTFQENIRLKLELQFQNRETERIINMNKRTMAENKELRYLLNLSKHTELEMSRKLGKYRRALTKQQEKLVSLGQNMDEMTVITSVCNMSSSAPAATTISTGVGGGHSLYDGEESVVSELGEASASQWLPDIHQTNNNNQANSSSPQNFKSSHPLQQQRRSQGSGPALNASRRRRSSNNNDNNSDSILSETSSRNACGLDAGGSADTLSYHHDSLSSPSSIVEEMSSLGSITTKALTINVRVEQMRKREKMLKQENQLRHSAGGGGNHLRHPQHAGHSLVGHHYQKGMLMPVGKKIQLRRPPGFGGGGQQYHHHEGNNYQGQQNEHLRPPRRGLELDHRKVEWSIDDDVLC